MRNGRGRGELKHQGRSRSLLRGEPFNLFGSTSQSLSEVVPLPPARFNTLSAIHRLRSADGNQSLDRKLVRADTTAIVFDGGRSRSVRARKSRSNDFLDRMDSSVESTTTDEGRSARQRRKSIKQRAKMNKIEKGLWLGNMEAATDVILLESHEITHIVTLDSVPLPRKISSFLPRMSILHLQVTDLPDEDILSHIEAALDFIRNGMESGGTVLVHCFRGKSRSATVVLAFLMRKYR